MTKQERSILEKLDKLVQSATVCAEIEPVVDRVTAELARQSSALMTWEPLPLQIFGDQLPAAIRSAWVFVLRAGSDTGAERHPNSHQRMMTVGGKGDMQLDTKEAPNDVASESDINWKSNILVSDQSAPLESRWISIPQNIWHRPVIPAAGDWVVVSFHTAPTTELIEERPGAKQTLYESARKRTD